MFVYLFKQNQQTFLSHLHPVNKAYVHISGNMVLTGTLKMSSSTLSGRHMALFEGSICKTHALFATRRNSVLNILLLVISKLFPFQIILYHKLLPIEIT